MHVLIFAAFLVLSLRTITLFGMGYSAGFHLPLLGAESRRDGCVYLFARTLSWSVPWWGAGYFIVLRALKKPDRMTQSWEAYLILGFIAGLMITEHDVRGERACASEGELRPGATVSSAAGAASRGWGSLPRHCTRWARSATGCTSASFSRSQLPALRQALPRYHRAAERLCEPPVAHWPAFEARFSRAPRARRRQASDLTWKQGLDVYSCTECGRCQTNCPTYVTGKL